MGSELEASFAKMTGKVMNETEHFVSISPEWTETVKTFSKRDIACASASQEESFKRTPRRSVILFDSASQSETEEPAKKKTYNKKG